MNFIVGTDKSLKAVEDPVLHEINAHNHLCGDDIYLQKNHKDSQLLMKPVDMLNNDDVVVVVQDITDSKAFYIEEKDLSNENIHHVTPGDVSVTVTASASVSNNSNSSCNSSSVIIDLIDDNDSRIVQANSSSSSGATIDQIDSTIIQANGNSGNTTTTTTSTTTTTTNNNNNNNNNNNTSVSTNKSHSQSLGIFSHRLFKIDQTNSLQFLQSTATAADVSSVLLPTTDNLKYLKVTKDGNDDDGDDDDDDDDGDDDVSLQSLDDDDDVDVVDSSSEDGMKDKGDQSSYEEEDLSSSYEEEEDGDDMDDDDEYDDTNDDESFEVMRQTRNRSAGKKNGSASGGGGAVGLRKSSRVKQMKSTNLNDGDGEDGDDQDDVGDDAARRNDDDTADKKDLVAPSSDEHHIDKNKQNHRPHHHHHTTTTTTITTSSSTISNAIHEGAIPDRDQTSATRRRGRPKKSLSKEPLNRELLGSSGGGITTPITGDHGHTSARPSLLSSSAKASSSSSSAKASSSSSGKASSSSSAKASSSSSSAKASSSSSAKASSSSSVAATNEVIINVGKRSHKPTSRYIEQSNSPKGQQNRKKNNTSRTSRQQQQQQNKSKTITKWTSYKQSITTLVRSISKEQHFLHLYEQDENLIINVIMNNNHTHRSVGKNRKKVQPKNREAVPFHDILKCKRKIFEAKKSILSVFEEIEETVKSYTQ